jgi:5'(3')-deoxyribonucleotidase
MKKRPRLLFDVDGVLTHGFTETFCQVLSQLLGAECRPEDVDQWDIIASFGAHRVEKEAYDAMREQGVCRAFQPNPGSQELIAKCQEWADVYAVTAPLGSIYWPKEREEWLTSLYQLHHHHVASVHDKFIVSGNALVEDKTPNLVAWAEEYPSGLPILFRIPPNRNDKWKGPEANNYDELYTLLETLRQ